MPLSVVELSLIGAISLVVLKTLFFSRPARRLPPGPKGLPLLGNLFNFPAVEEWVVFKDLGEQYNSDIIYYNVAPRSTPISRHSSCSRHCEQLDMLSVLSDKSTLAVIG
ncbi:hypothetical protein CPB85DRAFT_896606 [Mucidula mucida]|nr:hypothetical protein CPB85DRAFT_896606 [Mucidula mucida]